MSHLRNLTFAAIWASVSSWRTGVAFTLRDMSHWYRLHNFLLYFFNLLYDRLLWWRSFPVVLREILITERLCRGLNVLIELIKALILICLGFFNLFLLFILLLFELVLPFFVLFRVIFDTGTGVLKDFSLRYFFYLFFYLPLFNFYCLFELSWSTDYWLVWSLDFLLMDPLLRQQLWDMPVGSHISIGFVSCQLRDLCCHVIIISFFEV